MPIKEDTLIFQSYMVDNRNDLGSGYGYGDIHGNGYGDDNYGYYEGDGTGYHSCFNLNTGESFGNGRGTGDGDGFGSLNGFNDGDGKSSSFSTTF